MGTYSESSENSDEWFQFHHMPRSLKDIEVMRAMEFNYPVDEMHMVSKIFTV